MIEILNEENFEEFVNKESGKYVAMVHSDSCSPCHAMAPVFEKLDSTNPEVQFFKINSSDCPRISSFYQVRGVPTFIYGEGEKILFQISGATPYGNLQYILNQLDDPGFRETGILPIKQEKTNSNINMIFGIIIFIMIIGYGIILYS